MEVAAILKDRGDGAYCVSSEVLLPIGRQFNWKIKARPWGSSSWVARSSFLWVTEIFLAVILRAPWDEMKCVQGAPHIHGYQKNGSVASVLQLSVRAILSKLCCLGG